MWLFTDIGYFSVVRHEDAHDQVLIRSWVRKDLESLRTGYLPELGPIREAEGTFRYRAAAPAAAFSAACRRLADAIDYGNFEEKVALVQGRGRAGLYGGVWELARRLEKEDDALRARQRQGAIVESEDGRLLLRKPPAAPEACAWTFAKGRRRLGESPEDAAARIARSKAGVVSAQVLGEIPGTFYATRTESSYQVLRGDPRRQSDPEGGASTCWAAPERARVLFSQSPHEKSRERDLAVLDAYLQWRSSALASRTAEHTPADLEKALSSFVQSLEVGEPLHCLNLTVFPLHGPNGSKSPYLLLSEAIESGLAGVEEVSEGASVPTLSVVNRGERPVLIVDGEIFEGAMQNRMANISMMVGASSNWTLPVSCVEQGRWSSVSPTFRSTRNAPTGLRARSARAVQEGRTERRGRTGDAGNVEERGRSDQGLVWEEVRRRLDRLGARSATGSLSEGFEQAEAGLEAYRRQLGRLRDCRGILVAAGERVLSMDVFDSPATFEALSKRLTDGYFLEALDDPSPCPVTSTAAARVFLDRVARGIREGEGRSSGAGREIEVVGPGVVGQGVWFAERVCHLAAFSVENPSPYARALEVAVQTARDVAEIFRSDFYRPDGPRGSHGKAPADAEAEGLIRTRFESEFPEHGIVGEELGQRNRPSRDAQHHVWLIDPNDGTRAYIKGMRGPSISISLLRNGEPVLGVVLVHGSIQGEDAGDLFAWAEGCGNLTRNGKPIVRPPWAEELTGEHTVFVSQDADKASRKNAELVAPARFRAMPSIATRLALVAAGEGEVGTSLNSPGALDVAAGHALLRGVGGELYFEGGKKVTYTAKGACAHGNFFGGSPIIARELAKRSGWSSLRACGRRANDRGPGAATDLRLDLLRPAPGQAVADRGRLLRATGCLVGQLAGDALGSLVEFKTEAQILRDHPNCVRRLVDGGTWNTIAGQPTDDSELALILARTLVAQNGFDVESIARGYARWHASGPFDCGSTIGAALQAAEAALKRGQPVAGAATEAANASSESNGALMRISPLGIFGSGLAPEQIVHLAREDARLTHPHRVCRDSSAVFAVAIAMLVSGRASRGDVLDAVLELAESIEFSREVIAVLGKARNDPPEDFSRSMGHAAIALQNAFFQLEHAPSLEEGVVDTVRRGGDTDTNAAIAGALLGAAHGLNAIPAQWLDRILTCRPLDGLPGVRQPRPRSFWPVDALVLAEKLLLCGGSVFNGDAFPRI